MGEKSGPLWKRGLAMVLALAVAAAMALALWLWDQGREQVCQRQLFAMDTVMTLTAYGPEGEAAVAEAARELQRLDALWSVGRPDSEISRLNDRRTGTVSADTAALLERALDLSGETEGLFDPTIYPLVELWGFPSGAPHVPDPADIAATLPLVDSAQVTLAGETVTLGPGQKLDLGGIAKGYASARVMEIFRAHGVEAGVVYLGGNVQTLGSRSWKVGIQDPGDAAATLGELEVENKAVITSGGYERFFEENGQRYIHILDPRTGCPAQSDLQSATVISEDGVLADALSTALYIMGSEEAAAFWADRADQFDMVLLTQSGELLVTQGVADRFETRARVRVLTTGE